MPPVSAPPQPIPLAYNKCTSYCLFQYNLKKWQMDLLENKSIKVHLYDWLLYSINLCI